MAKRSEHQSWSTVVLTTPLQSQNLRPRPNPTSLRPSLEQKEVRNPMSKTQLCWLNYWKSGKAEHSEGLREIVLFGF